VLSPLIYLLLLNSSVHKVLKQAGLLLLYCCRVYQMWARASGLQ
jgi:hypothetical protein